MSFGIDKTPTAPKLSATKQIAPAAKDDLTALAAKIAAGTATASDKARFRKLAAKV